MTTDTSAHSEVRVGHVHLKVADLERAIAFYRDALGFTVTQRMGRDAAFLAAGAYHHHVGLNTWESGGGAPPPPGSTGLYHAAFLYPSRRALARALERLRAAGIPLDGAADHGVSEALYLRDPDGNGLELYRDRPAGDWPRGPDGSLAMFTRPLDLEDLLATPDEGGGGGPGAEAAGRAGAPPDAAGVRFDPPLAHAPRRVTFHGVRRAGPWSVKLYGVAGSGDRVTPRLLAIAVDVATRTLPLPAVTAGRYGIGFAIVHEAPAFNTIVVDWWEQVNELRHRVFRALPAAPERFEDITARGESVCVWELGIQAHERELWIAGVLGGDAEKGIAAYAGAGLDGLV